MHDEKKHPANYLDLTGQKFGKLTVKERTNVPEYIKNKERVYWLCDCDCGGTLIASTSNLRGGRSWHCGCEKISRMKRIFTKDLTGQRFGRLVVLKQDNNYVSPNGNTNTKWLCQCDCGNIVSVMQPNLRNGDTQSCGCLHLERISNDRIIDLTGQKFGMLNVIKRIENKEYPSGGRHIQYLCQCDCGNHSIVTGSNLSSGHTVSCGCLNSKNERIIGNILNDYDCIYKPQYIFKDCVYKGYLKFDFAVFKNNQLLFLIEYDGQQHTEPVNYGGLNEEDLIEAFKINQIRDEIKNKYCVEHNITLYRISYKNQDKLEQIIREIMKNNNIQLVA